MGGTGYVYTCSCTSLISSCGNNTTTDRPLWRQFKGPYNRTAAVSYTSRLVIIDGDCIIKAYSSVSESWVEATSTGDSRYQNYASIVADAVLPTVADAVLPTVAAAVLPTGELVYTRRFGGVYKVKLSGEKEILGNGVYYSNCHS